MRIIFLLLTLFMVACGGAAPLKPNSSVSHELPKEEEPNKVKPKLIWKDPSSIKNTDKPTFIFFTWEKCEPCRGMKLVFEDELLVKQLSLFNTVMIEESDPDFEVWAKKYKVGAFPTYVILASTQDRDFISSFVGYVTAENLTYYLGNAYAANKLFLLREQADGIIDLF